MKVSTQLIEKVKEFRNRTGLGLQDAKHFVEAANLDLDKAIEMARLAGKLTYVPTKPDSSLAHGVVASAISEDGQRGVLVELICYTDFAARTDTFKEAASLMARGLLVKAPQDVMDRIVEVTSTKLKEPVRLHRHEVFDMRNG